MASAYIVLLMTDQQLLDRYRHQRDPEAFAEIVARHGQLVYATARRLSPADAEDIAQAVFLLLSQRATTVRAEPSLAGWLYQATRYCARNAMKMRQRREYHEQKAAAMQQTTASTGSRDLREVLDDGLAGIGDAYRQVLLLRYLEELSLEETAGRLAISVPAVAKRAERGLEKLRRVLESRGHAISNVAMASAVAHEAAQQLPVGLLQKMAGVSAGSVGPTVTAMAAGARTGFMMAKIAVMAKVVAALVVLIGGVGLTAAGVLRQATPEPIVNEADPSAPGQVRLVRTKQWVDEKVALALKAAGKPVATKSQWFAAMLVPSDALHRALEEVQLSGGETDLNQLRSPEQPVGFPGYGAPPMGAGVGKDRSGVVRIEPSFGGKHEHNRRSGGLELHLAMEGLKAIHFSAKGETRVPAAIVFDGEVPGGTALVFLGGFENEGAYCLDIWESVRMTDAQAKAMQGVESGRWFTRTPAGWRDFADRAFVWQSGGKPIEQSDRMTQRLGETQQVQLLGISQPGKWPGCWWTPAGKPIRGVTGYPSTAKAVAAVRVLTVPEVKDSRVQDVHTWNATGGSVIWGGSGIEEMVVELPDETGSLTVEVAGAQWRRLGVVDQQNPLMAGQTLVKIDRASQVDNGMCTLELSSERLPDEAVRLVALDADGQEVGRSQYLGHMRMPARWHRDPQGSDRLFLTFYNLKGKAVKFAVELSPYQAAQFDGFALTPAVTPPSAVAAPQVKQAVENEDDQRVAEAAAKWAAAKQRYEAVVTDDATPQGLFKRMLEAASAGRSDDVAACITSSEDAFEKQRTRLFAQVLSATTRCNDAVVTRFGLELLVREQVQLKIASKYEQMVYDWHIDGDRATATDGGLTMLRSNGHWRLEGATLRQKMATHVVRWAEGLEKIRAAVADGTISTTKQLNDALGQLPDS